MPLDKTWDIVELKVPVLDYITDGENRVRKLLKTASMNALGYFRDKRARMRPNLFDMVPKLMAMRNL